jgi:hypothetical protein
MPAIRNLTCFCAVLGIVLGTTTCIYGEMPKSPQGVVEKYCSLDGQGANINASNPNAKAIYDLLINEDEAGYDTSVIIKSYRIGKVSTGKESADVEVIYAVLGTLAAGSHAKRNPHAETVNFHLTLVDKSWKIDGLRIPPHLTQVWILSKMRRSLAADEKVGKKDPLLKAALDEISQW